MLIRNFVAPKVKKAAEVSRNFLKILFIVVAALLPQLSSGQITVIPGERYYDADSVIREFDKRPYFSLFKDNYIAVGSELGSRPTAKNTDLKFQVSFRQRLTRTVLPFHTYLFLSYSQKCLWYVFDDPNPVHDLNFNPGIGFTRPIVDKDRVVGNVTLMLEHESNGRDSIFSRSWNKISLGGNLYITPSIMVHGKFWIPIIDGKNNSDILDYYGIFQAGVQFVSPNKRWVFSALVTKRKGWNLNANTMIQFGFRLHRDANQFLFAEYFNGYGESLLDYNRYHSRLRVGILIRPQFFSDF